MSFNLYWGRKLLKNKSLIECEKLTITVESFRLELERAYLAGQREPLPAYKESSPLDSLFNGFGSK